MNNDGRRSDPPTGPGGQVLARTGSTQRHPDARPRPTPLGGWRVRGAGDLDKDGHVDLVLQNQQTWQVSALFLGGPRGTDTLGGTWIAEVGLVGWRVVGVVDVDGDGHADLVWQNDATRQVAAFYLGGAKGTDVISANWLQQDGTPGFRAIAK